MPQKKDSFIADSFTPDEDTKDSFIPDEGPKDTGIWAGIKRGVSNLNPLPLLSSFGAGPPTAPEDIQAGQESFQHALEHPFATALGSIPIIGPMVGGLAERAPQDPLGTLAEAGTMAAAGKVAGAAVGKVPAISDRLVASMLKPDKNAFDFGADPVQATIKSGAWGTNWAEFKGSLREKINQTEAILTRAAELNKYKKYDVAPSIRSSIQPMVDQATLDANPSLARRLDRIATNRISAIQSKYGTTELTPEQVLAEKRALKSEVKFSTDETQLNVNRAKMNIYRAYDQGLDSMIPHAKELNQHYSGLIEADRLTDRQMALNRKANILDIRSKSGPALLKSGIPQLLKTTRETIPIDLREPPTPAGLLPSPAIPMGPVPDTSYARGVTPKQPLGLPYPRETVAATLHAPPTGGPYPMPGPVSGLLAETSVVPPPVPPASRALPPPSMRPMTPLSPSSEEAIQEFLKRNKPVDWRKAKAKDYLKEKGKK